MTKTRLAAALSLALLVAPVSQAAKYTVVELPVTDEGRNSFPSAINEDGNITVNVKSPFNIPIDLDLLDFESDTLVALLTDVQAASNGDFNSVDYQLLLALIGSADGSQSAQQIANTVSFLATENETNYITGFDELIDQSNQYSISTNTTVRDINNAGMSVGGGEGFYNKVDYTLDDGDDVTFVVHEFGTRGFVSLGNTVVDLPAPEIIAGGFSDAFGINESNQVVGYGTTSFLSDALETAVTDCEDEELVDDDDSDSTDFPSRGDVPIESCISSVVSTFTSSITSYAQLRGLIWQLDDQGNLLDTKELGLLFEPEADDTKIYSSQAIAINDNGIAVGISNGEYTESDVTVIRNYAVIYDGDEVINLTPDPERIVARTSVTISSANDINNDNLVVGYQRKSINGTNRKKFFVYDMNLSELTFPDDFFLGSSSEALDINNNGLVVGYGEVDASLTGRRTEGFLYDHVSKEFNGMQSLVGCDSPYTIVQANSINDNNEIVATALYRGPSKDASGEVILDTDGSEIIVDLVKAIKLVPIVGGETESCETPDEINRDRQGANLSWILGLGLLLLGWRRFKNSI
ncbi:DUF3466 family protein [uncultured Paraglaciecola sp.]|uniref:DUF3466 family protein n=1 Tax=uncultured Paraglaciecola sp. TaxID=1765024 RepID=UPI0030D74A80|tara:strand:+ start:119817 stop:121553 length:1737 start_codon:yes stop_codon:yes gene_type:complete